jgi:hypothetical protein
MGLVSATAKHDPEKLADFSDKIMRKEGLSKNVAGERRRGGDD